MSLGGSTFRYCKDLVKGNVNKRWVDINRVDVNYINGYDTVKERVGKYGRMSLVVPKIKTKIKDTTVV